MKTLKDLGDLKGKRVLVRADFNVPLDGTTITDDGRIKAALPTIKALREEGAKVILMAHLGRPKGKVVPELSLAPVAARLGELLGIEVPLAEDTYGEDAQAKVAAMNDGDVVLLQNVRYNPEETSKDPEERSAYAKKIAALGEAFVSDGFGVVHRAQGSNYDVAADLPAAAGLLVEKEVKALSRATVEPERPLTVVLGGSKVSDKLGVIENLLDKANRLVIGGGMVVTVDDNGVCTYCSMRAGAMARYPQRYKSCEEYLVGKKLSWETMLGCLPIMHDQVYEANKSRPSVFYKKESIQGVYKHLFADVLRKLNIEEVQGF